MLASFSVLKALVNNAGVMVFGEFAWQTEELIQQQIDVNLVGAMKVTKAFLPMIVNNKGSKIYSKTTSSLYDSQYMDIEYMN